MASISIAMATYNGAKFIREQLNSLAMQTILPSEIIITDDCSSDDTLQIANEFAATSPFKVTVRRNETRLGYRGNFIHAASMCTSEIIACCDQDDVWLPEKLKTVVGAFEDPEVMLVHHNSIIVDDSGDIGYLRNDAVPHIHPWFAAYGHTLTFKRELADFSNLWDLSTSADVSGRQDGTYISARESHDHWFFFLASHLGKIAYIETPLVRYRQHGTNAEPWTTGGWLNKWVTRLGGRGAVFEIAAENARARSEALKSISTLPQYSEKRASLLTASEHYAKSAAIYADRSSLYRSKDLARRVLIFYQLLRSGAYGKSALRSFSSGAKDGVIGVLFGGNGSGITTTPWPKTLTAHTDCPAFPLADDPCPREQSRA